MHVEGQIRVLALGLIKKDNRVFISQGYDPVKQKTFYRAMGGGVDFGETSIEALEREFQEEIQAKLTNISYLGCLENLFTFNGKQGHELLQVYQCDFVDAKFYELESLVFAEGKRQKTALWVDVALFKSGELLLVPEPFLALL
ncbi:NUDIX hydrolase [Chlorogloea sp. CCALA 695]|uniref:NUDIX hydrolase n=1 Tax=Chlorogloea sp. CCALA 695 TaxID=2107693 RepID=UPI000D052CDF|nr:NUDIX hydrolase [Chlorogloea sp. CCALA 695]PSB24237.1 NUDIX hydrolase [Chlorogloea sp. CCALA 695]